MENPEKKVNAACWSGDTAALKALFTELDVKPNHDSLPDDERPSIGRVGSMLLSAAWKGHVETFRYLFSYFDDCKVEPAVILQAMDNGHVEMLKEICSQDPDAVKLEISHGTLLVHACGGAKNPDMVKVLLNAGADPNEQTSHLLPRADKYIVSCGLPASTMEQFFDAGYEMEYGGPMSDAIKEGRADIVEVLYRRGRELKEPVLPSAKELMKASKATKNNQQEMIALTKRLFPKEYDEKDGFMSTILKKLHS